MPVYSLVVGKSGPKFKESTPGEPHPNGKRLPGNSGVMVPDEATQTVHLYETSRATLAPLLPDITGPFVKALFDDAGDCGCGVADVNDDAQGEEAFCVALEVIGSRLERGEGERA
jgi:uncharacterized protein (TIGR03435 family)